MHLSVVSRAFDNEIVAAEEATSLAATITDIPVRGSASPRFLHNAVANATLDCYAVHLVRDNDPRRISPWYDFTSAAAVAFAAIITRARIYSPVRLANAEKMPRTIVQRTRKTDALHLTRDT